MNSVDISVIVPVYNCANYLTDLLDSLRSQTGVSLEIIAVNDGSTDHSLALLEQVAHIDSRLVIINQQNQGFLRPAMWGSPRRRQLGCLCRW